MIAELATGYALNAQSAKADLRTVLITALIAVATWV